MRKIVLMALAFYSAASGQTGVDGWDLFARVKFESRFFKDLNTYYLVPVFDQRISSLEGSEVTLKGYYLPFDMPKDHLIVSRYPYSSCFFCGGSGPESIAEAILKSKSPKLKVDQIITVKGKLKLNDKDLSHMNFILEEAEIIGN